MPMNFAERIDYALLCEPVALQLWGEPTKADDKELRWGTHGSRCLDRRTGRWFDHEQGEGGSTIELLKRELRYESFGECQRWLYNNGIIRANGQTNGNGKTEFRARYNGATNGKAKAPLGKIVETYLYRDESGNVLSEKVKYEPKAFSQRRPDGTPNLEGVRRVLY